MAWVHLEARTWLVGVHAATALECFNPVFRHLGSGSSEDSRFYEFFFLLSFRAALFLHSVSTFSPWGRERCPFRASSRFSHIEFWCSFARSLRVLCGARVINVVVPDR